MQIPGSRPLHEWRLGDGAFHLDELLLSCRETGLTGTAEIRFPDAAGVIFYYLGLEASVLYREGPVADSGAVALARLRARGGHAAAVSVCELPLDLAHLLRGAVNRRRLEEGPASAPELKSLLRGLERSGHTGTLEVRAPHGSGVVLLVGGRVANVYWKAGEGDSVEGAEARARLEQAVATGVPRLYLAEFSQEAWKARQGLDALLADESVVEAREPVADSCRRLLDQLVAKLPSVQVALVFDLESGQVLARRASRAPALCVAPLADRLPRLTVYLVELARAQGEEPLELFELRLAGSIALATLLPGRGSGIALVADRSQPTALLASTLAQAVGACGHAAPGRAHAVAPGGPPQPARGNPDAKMSAGAPACGANPDCEAARRRLAWSA